MLLTRIINGEEDDGSGQNVNWDNVRLHAVAMHPCRVATHPFESTHQLEEPVMLVWVASDTVCPHHTRPAMVDINQASHTGDNSQYAYGVVHTSGTTVDSA